MATKFNVEFVSVSVSSLFRCCAHTLAIGPPVHAIKADVRRKVDVAAQ